MESCYSTNRTLRKTSVTHLECVGFGNKFINRMNKWRAQEQSKGQFLHCRMNAHYAEAMLLAALSPFINLEMQHDGKEC